MSTTPETPESEQALLQLLAAVTQGNRFDVTLAIEALIDAKLASLFPTSLSKRKGQHPVEAERQIVKNRRAEQDARLLAAKSEEKQIEVP